MAKGAKLTKEEKALRNGRNCGVLNDAEKELFVRLVKMGACIKDACRQLRRSNMTIRTSRDNDPEFEAAVIKALKERVISHVEDSCVRLATGEVEIVTETFLPVLDADKKPMMNPDGTTMVYLASKIVRHPAPSLAAQKLFLKGNKPETYGSLKLNENKGEVGPTLDMIDKDELEKLLDKTADKLAGTSGPTV